MIATVGCFHGKDEDTGSACVPEAEIPYDSLDQDCDGYDLTDVDGDGHDAAEAGGDDCDDEDPATYPGAVEVPYDGVDQDCDGADLADLDGDGYAADEAGGDDCDDGNADINPGVAEHWYDGVDQDCDGESDYDMDADGHDDAAHGGTDCDDGDPATFPGAPETAYDGIDQDCDGADLTDVDGDGYDAVEVGGDDCDDGEPAVYPDAPEVAADGVDQDCDGRVDEYLVCADGTGDFATVQDGIDGTPEGAILELCPGVYEEDLDVSGREIDIEGGGEEPDDVVLRGVSASYHVVTGTGTDARLYWLAMESNGSGGQRGVNISGADTLALDTVDLCSADAEYVVFLMGSCYHGASLVISRCHICNHGPGNDFSYLYQFDSCEFALEQSIVEQNSDGGYDFQFVLDESGVAFSNNIFMGNATWISASGAGSGVDSNAVSFTNNTVSASHFAICTARTTCDSEPWPFNTSATNNIFSGLNGPLLVAWSTSHLAYEDLLPSHWVTNLAWALVGSYASSVLYSCSDPGSSESDDSFVSAALESSSIVADPLFTLDPMMGSFALDPSSPAVDAGSGDPDPDGSPADLGAFGGPGGDWWQEVPWQLP